MNGLYGIASAMFVMAAAASMAASRNLSKGYLLEILALGSVIAAVLMLLKALPLDSDKSSN